MTAYKTGMAMKVLVLGAGGAGKSATIHRLLYDTFVGDYDPTIEDAYRKQVDFQNMTFVLDLLEVQDLSSTREGMMIKRRAPTEKPSQYDTRCVLFVYDITRTDTLQECIKFYNEMELKKKTAVVPTLFIGNKCDRATERQVPLDEAKALLAELGATEVMECSAKEATNKEAAMQKLCELVCRNLGPPAEEKKKKACALV